MPLSFLASLSVNVGVGLSYKDPQKSKPRERQSCPCVLIWSDRVLVYVTLGCMPPVSTADGRRRGIVHPEETNGPPLTRIITSFELAIWLPEQDMSSVCSVVVNMKTSIKFPPDLLEHYNGF